MLSTIVQAGLVAVDGITFGERVACPVCGGPVWDTIPGKKCLLSSAKMGGSVLSGSR